MLKLLHASLFRLRKSRLLWLCMAVTFAVSSAFARKMGGSGEITWKLDVAILQVFPFLSILYAAFLGLFLGAEYQDGTIRNKIVAGHTRSSVYLSQLGAAVLGCLGIMLAWAMSAPVGSIRLGWFTAPWRTLLLRLVVLLMTLGATSAILTLVAMLIPNRAVSSVAVILTALALLLLSAYFYNALCEPETHPLGSLTENGFSIGEPAPNPNYIGGTLRTVYQFLTDTLPAGQAILLANEELAKPALSLGASLLITLLTAGAGILAFRRKDLK